MPTLIGTRRALLSGRKAASAILSDSFAGGSGAALSGLWTAQLGTFVVNGSGKARGATLAADGINIIPNGEFTLSLAGWSVGGGATSTRRDFTSSPDIDPTGGSDDFGLEIQSNGDLNSRVYRNTTAVTGVTYSASVRAHSPSSNTGINIARLDVGSGPQTTVEDIWQTLSASVVGAASNIEFMMMCKSATIGDVAYFDACSAQATYALATCDPVTANADIRVPATLPASGVKPFGILARYQDASNYWLWRIMPGTAGTDFELLEVNAGVATQRASADIDWVAGSTYSLRFTHSAGNVFTAYVDGVQKLTYTDGSAFNATETLFGLLEAGATNGLFGTWEVWAL